MILAALNVTLFVGTTANKEEDLRQELTVGRLKEMIESFATEHQLGCTLTPTFGVDATEKEDSMMVLFSHHINQQTSPEAVVGFCEAIHQLLLTLLTSFHQNWIKVEVKLTLPEKPIEWTTETQRSQSGLVSPPFVLPSLIARQLAGAGIISHDAFAYTKLYEAVADHYSRILRSDIQRRNFPVVCSEASADLACPQDVRELLENPDAVRAWDASIVQACPESIPAKARPEYQERGEFIARFQQVTLDDVYYVPRLVPLLDLHAEPIQLARCPYLVGAGCTEGAYLHTLSMWLAAKGKPERFSQFLADERGLKHLRDITRSMIGVNVILLTADGAVAKQRSHNTGSYPGQFMLIPAGQLAPVGGWDAPSVFWTVIHELDEELFGGDEHRELHGVRSEEHICDLAGSITYLGYHVEPMNDHVVVYVLLEPTNEWWRRYKSKVTRCWELVGKRPDYVDLDQPRSDLVPGVYSGIELARRVLGHRNTFNG